MKVRKAVITAAGWGTRFLPLTKAQPKELLPLIEKPVIQHAVEEIIDSGIEQIIIITSLGKRAIEDYFGYLPELEWRLEQQGKLERLEKIRELRERTTMIYIHQQGPYGNATPVKEARKVVGDEPFVVVWGDQFIGAKPSRLLQCLDVYSKYSKG